MYITTYTYIHIINIVFEENYTHILTVLYFFPYI